MAFTENPYFERTNDSLKRLCDLYTQAQHPHFEVFNSSTNDIFYISGPPGSLDRLLARLGQHHIQGVTFTLARNQKYDSQMHGKEILDEIAITGTDKHDIAGTIDSVAKETAAEALGADTARLARTIRSAEELGIRGAELKTHMGRSAETVSKAANPSKLWK